jgi:phage terminase large subunit GpA-like protein
MLAWMHSCGIPLRPLVFTIDAGFNTEMVAAFVKVMKRCGVNVVAVVGREHTKVPEIISGTLPSKKGKHKMEIYTINDDRAKRSVLSRLKIPKPGGGYVHFPNAPWCNVEYFEQLLSEKKVRVRENKVIVEKWIRKPGVRNEPFDCKKYALAALIWQQKHKWTKHVMVNGKPIDPLDAHAAAMALRVEQDKLARMERGELPTNEYFMARAKAVQEKMKSETRPAPPRKSGSWMKGLKE